MSSPTTPIDRYHAYLQRAGVRPDAARIVEDGGLALGGFHFYRVDARGGAEWRAAASATGVVGGIRAPGDAWWDLLAAGDAATLADRIAWLESTPDVDRRSRGRRITVVRPADKPPAAAIDPQLWRAAVAPTARTGPDLRALTVWLYVAGAAEPVELTIRAHPSGPAEIVERPGHDVIALGDPIPRARAALDGNDKVAIGWALYALAKQGDAASAPAIAKLLSRGDADVRALAAGTLGQLAAASTIDAIAAAAAVERDEIALTSEIQALGHMPSPAAARALASLRASIKDPDERVEVIHALARLHDSAPTEVHAGLADAAAHDPDPELRDLAKSYLHDFGP